MVAREVMNETYKKGKGEEDKHPLFKKNSSNEIIKSIKIKRLMRKLIRAFSSK
jgi:hypothetical protein